MECERLNRLVRSWYIEVQDEALAPGRMVEFMEKHVMDCDVCLTDPDVRYEVKKIKEIVLPPPKVIKKPKEKNTEEVSPPVPDTVEPGNVGPEGDDVGENDAATPPVTLEVEDEV
jgi:hypothetical protein